MTRKEYLAKRKASKEVLRTKILKSYKRHYKPELRAGLVAQRVTKDCNVSLVTYYEAIRGAN